MSEYFLADDLSGALDAAAAFHAGGRRVRIALSETWPAIAEGEVLGVTTETRNALPQRAAAKVRAVLERAKAEGRTLVFKKIDSTMRGPVAAELAEVTKAMPGVRVLFTPANPAVGRTVRSGMLYVRGVAVAETEFARDPVWPVRESALQELLGAVEETVCIQDAETQADLQQAARALDALGLPWLAVGSGALAKALVQGDHPSQLVRWPDVSGAKILFVCGSAHLANRQQAAKLEERVKGVALRRVSLGDPARAAEAGVQDLRSASVGVLQIEEARGESGAALRAISEASARMIEAEEVRRVFVTGGETAFALCAALGISTLTFLEEIEAGVSVSIAEWRGGSLVLAVKPGGFGDAQTWVRVWERMKGEVKR